MTAYRLPPRFYYDHRERDLPEEGVSEIVRETKTAVFVEMDEPAFHDLWSDADYYSDATTASQMGGHGLASSARATTRALRKQNPELAARVEADLTAIRRAWLTR